MIKRYKQKTSTSSKTYKHVR